MKHKTLFLLLFVVVGVSLFFTLQSNGQGPAEDTQFLQNILGEKIKAIEKWESLANFLRILTLLVAVLGAITGIMQKFTTKWSKAITAISGGAISILTVVMNTVYQVDYKELTRAAHEARGVITDVQFLIEKVGSLQGASPEDRQVLFNEVREQIRKIDDLGKNLNIAYAMPTLTATAYAASPSQSRQDTSWISRPPVDPNYFYFVGIGDSRSLRQAKQYSYDNAVERAVDYLSDRFVTATTTEEHKLQTDKLSKYLVESAETASTYFTSDRATGFFRYYTLLKLDKRRAESDLLFYGAQNRTPIAQAYQDVLQQSKQTANDYTARRTATYEKALDVAQKALGPDLYEQLNKARELRKNGKNQEAIEILQGIVQKKPEVYLAWYNLALAYEAQHDNPAAQKAYLEAIRLESKLPSRDASLYNSYGVFLMAQRKFTEAAVQFRQALAIDPAHDRAKRNLELAIKNRQ